MLDKLKKKIDNAFNAASKKYDEVGADVLDCVPLSATAVFLAELAREFAGKDRPKQP